MPWTSKVPKFKWGFAKRKNQSDAWGGEEMGLPGGQRHLDIFLFLREAGWAEKDVLVKWAPASRLCVGVPCHALDEGPGMKDAEKSCCKGD